MKRRFLNIIFPALLGVVACITALTTPASAADNYFPYPTAPDTMQNLYDRTDYIVTHFWDRCDMKKAFSARQKMSGALRDYLELMPYATRRAAHKSVAALLKSLEKQPDDLLFITGEAEKYLYGDSALYLSEELLLPFIRAAAVNKKTPKADREAYEKKSQILMRSMIGAPTPFIAFTSREGEQKYLTDVPDSTSLTLLIIDTPDCLDCRLNRTFLNANINVTALIDGGALKVVSLFPSEPTDEWRQEATTYPDTWIVGAAPELTDFIDVRGNPYYVLMDNQGLIRLKTDKLSDILNIIGG